jgi:hypothetical protein
MLRSVANAASAAIDYSMGDVEEGVVDSSPVADPELLSFVAQKDIVESSRIVLAGAANGCRNEQEA